QPIFDLVLGLNRWVIRVGAYAALMTDAYPPFRLDQGGPDPDDSRLELSATTGKPPAPIPAPAPDAAALPTGGPRTRWTGGRTLLVVGGCLLLLFSLGLVGAGATAGFVDRAVRDDSGFVMTGDAA